MTAFGLELDEWEQQIIDYSGPYLGHDNVFRRAEKGFDFQVLLDPFEKYFDVPAGFVQIGDGTSSKLEIIGEKMVHFTGFLINIGDQVEVFRIVFLWFLAGQSDTAVGNDHLFLGTSCCLVMVYCMLLFAFITKKSFC